MIEHQAIVNRLEWMKDYYKVTNKDILLQKTTYTFDVSVWELFLSTCFGTPLVILPPGDSKDLDTIIDHSPSLKPFPLR